MKGPEAYGFDAILTSQVRLSIVAALVSLKEVDFMDLQRTLDVTKGNLSIHGQKLEEAGFIDILKSFQGRMPRTTYRITAKGHRALVEHVRRLEGFLKGGRS